jgi:3-isopropylmalate dehydrogenase
LEFAIAALPGDGIGPEVIAESVKVLDAIGARFGHSFEVRSGPIGGQAIDEFGTALPDETLELCYGTDAVLFGAAGGPKWDIADAKERPEGGILKLRTTFKLFANIRPAKAHPALYAASSLKQEYLEGVDLIVLRELIGGLYFSRPKKRWTTSTGKRRSVDSLKYGEEEIARVVRVGFELARQRKGKLASADKFNVMESSRLWREVATEIGEQYPDVELEHILADNLAMQLLRNPARFDVIVASNIFGDILSDEAAMLTGSLGMLPSASLAEAPGIRGGGKRLFGLYEPVHGSAPDIAGQGIANPLGTIYSTAMMLRYSLGLDEEADAVERAVEGVLSEGYCTPDLARSGGTVIGTRQMGDMITGSL